MQPSANPAKSRPRDQQAPEQADWDTCLWGRSQELVALGWGEGLALSLSLDGWVWSEVFSTGWLLILVCLLFWDRVPLQQTEWPQSCLPLPPRCWAITHSYNLSIFSRQCCNLGTDNVINSTHISLCLAIYFRAPPAAPWPWQLPSCCGTFPEFHINGAILCVAVCGNSFHLAESFWDSPMPFISRSFFLMAKEYAILWLFRCITYHSVVSVHQ